LPLHFTPYTAVPEFRVIGPDVVSVAIVKAEVHKTVIRLVGRRTVLKPVEAQLVLKVRDATAQLSI